MTEVTLTATDPEGLSVSVSTTFNTDPVNYPVMRGVEWMAFPSEDSDAHWFSPFLYLVFDQDLKETFLDRDSLENPPEVLAQFTVDAFNENGSRETIDVKHVLYIPTKLV